MYVFTHVSWSCYHGHPFSSRVGFLVVVLAFCAVSLLVCGRLVGYHGPMLRCWSAVCVVGLLFALVSCCLRCCWLRWALAGVMLIVDGALGRMVLIGCLVVLPTRLPSSPPQARRCNIIARLGATSCQFTLRHGVHAGFGRPGSRCNMRFNRSRLNDLSLPTE